jgi:hypothetical protein
LEGYTVSETGTVVSSIGTSGFHLITHGGNQNAQVTVNNRGDVLCPPNVRADDVDDLVGALIGAKDVAARQRELNDAAQAEPKKAASPAKAAPPKKRAAQ